MNKQTLWSLIVAGALVGGAQAAGPDLDLSQPPDPQPAGGPTGDGEDWEGDGRAPLTGDSSDKEGLSKAPTGKRTDGTNASGPQDDKAPGKTSAGAGRKSP